MGYNTLMESFADFHIDLKKLFDIREKLGLKVSDVFFFSKKENENPVWKQILPTPFIRKIPDKIILDEGGVYKSGDLFLKGFARSQYTRDDLETSTIAGDTEKYWIVSGRAYTTISIVEHIGSYDVAIRPYLMVNENELNPPE